MALWHDESITKCCFKFDERFCTITPTLVSETAVGIGNLQVFGSQSRVVFRESSMSLARITLSPETTRCTIESVTRTKHLTVS
jgi:hypothetical protein